MNNEVVYGIKLVGYDEQYQDCIITRKTWQATVDLADKILNATRGVSLMNALNDLQQETDAVGCFENKYTIPIKIVNLVTKPYGLILGVF